MRLTCSGVSIAIFLAGLSQAIPISSPHVVEDATTVEKPNPVAGNFTETLGPEDSVLFDEYAGKKDSLGSEEGLSILITPSILKRDPQKDFGKSLDLPGTNLTSIESPSGFKSLSSTSDPSQVVQLPSSIDAHQTQPNSDHRTLRDLASLPAWKELAALPEVRQFIIEAKSGKESTLQIRESLKALASSPRVKNVLNKASSSRLSIPPPYGDAGSSPIKRPVAFPAQANVPKIASSPASGLFSSLPSVSSLSSFSALPSLVYKGASSVIGGATSLASEATSLASGATSLASGASPFSAVPDELLSVLESLPLVGDVITQLSDSQMSDLTPSGILSILGSLPLVDEVPLVSNIIDSQTSPGYAAVASNGKGGVMSALGSLPLLGHVPYLGHYLNTPASSDESYSFY